MADNSILNRVLPDCYLYISHLDEGYQYWMLPGYPDEVTDQMTSNFQENSALGRSAPVYTFSNSGPRSVSISLTFHRDMFDEINRFRYPKGSKYFGSGNVGDNLSDKDFDDAAEDMAEKFIHAIQAIAVPKYNLSNKAVEPPLVAIRLGQEVFIKGIVSGAVSVTYSKPILSNEKYAIVKVGFTVSEVDPYDSSTVFKNGSFRGLTATLRTGMNF